MDSAGSNADCLIELGFLHLRFSEVGEAEKCLNRVLGFDPGHPRGNYGLAVVLYQQGKSDLAMRSFEQAFQSGKVDYNTIRKDPWMKDILVDKAFIQVKEANGK
jgi:Tfp pilus assembly protein PilF